MAETGLWHCGWFRLDVGAERRWHGSEPVRLSATACGVLRYLVAQAGQRVSKDTLLGDVQLGGQSIPTVFSTDPIAPGVPRCPAGGLGMEGRHVWRGGAA